MSHHTFTLLLIPKNVDHKTWLAAYKEDFDDLRQMDVYNVIISDQLHMIQHKSGRLIPTMCILTVKYKDEYPHCTKCRIVVLGNQQQ